MMLQVLFAVVALQAPPPPVDVVGCKTGIEISDMLYKTNGNYEIDFIDRDMRAIDQIAFDVHLGARVIPIRDAGKFSPTVLVSHRFGNRGGEVILAANPSVTCEVKWVHFTDGTDWRSIEQ